MHQVEHVDTDASGAMHFARYASLAETGVLDLFEQRGAGLNRLEAIGLTLVVRRLQAQYAAPAKHRDVLLVDSKIMSAGDVRIRTRTCLQRRREGEAPVDIATVELELVVVDRASGKPARAPREVARLWEELS